MTRFATLSLLAATILATPLAAVAQTAPTTDFQAAHPRRAQINQRMDNQNKRIDSLEAHGRINQEQAVRLHQEDHRIKMEEKHMANRQGGTLTPQQQARLNRQANQANKSILKSSTAQ